MRHNLVSVNEFNFTLSCKEPVTWLVHRDESSTPDYEITLEESGKATIKKFAYGKSVSLIGVMTVDFSAEITEHMYGSNFTKNMPMACEEKIINELYHCVKACDERFRVKSDNEKLVENAVKAIIKTENWEMLKNDYTEPANRMTRTVMYELMHSLGLERAFFTELAKNKMEIEITRRP